MDTKTQKLKKDLFQSDNTTGKLYSYVQSGLNLPYSTVNLTVERSEIYHHQCIGQGFPGKRALVGMPYWSPGMQKKKKKDYDSVTNANCHSVVKQR